MSQSPDALAGVVAQAEAVVVELVEGGDRHLYAEGALALASVIRLLLAALAEAQKEGKILHERLAANSGWAENQLIADLTAEVEFCRNELEAVRIENLGVRAQNKAFRKVLDRLAYQDREEYCDFVSIARDAHPAAPPAGDTGMSDKPKCKSMVLNGFNRYPCDKKAKLDGYCLTHNPARQRAKREAQAAKWNAEWDAMERKRKTERQRQDATAKLVEAVALCVMTGTSLPPIVASAYATLAEIPDAR